MKRFFAIIIICFTVYACNSDVPDQIIKPEQMEKVLFDIHVVDGYISNLYKPDTLKIVASSYYKGIYKKFKIDSAQYTRSMNYYYNHPDLLNKIYQNLQKSFEKEKVKNEKRIELEMAYKASATEKRTYDLINRTPNWNMPLIKVNPLADPLTTVVY